MTNQEAISKISEIKSYLVAGNPIWDTDVISEALDMGIDALKQMQWVPCSERLPEESDGTVIVCFPDEFPYNNKEPYINAKHNQRVKTASYSQFNKTWYIGDFNAIGEVMPIAWMPLPESYKGSED